MFGISNGKNNETCDDIEKQFNEAEEYRKTIENNEVGSHSQAVYTSRLLDLYTKKTTILLDKVHLNYFLLFLNML